MVQSVKRRRVVQLLGSGLLVSIAGCADDNGDGDESDDDHDHNGDDHDHDGDEEGGDEDDENGNEDNEGLVYAFAPNTIAIIDPEEGEVVDEISDGLDDEGWGDPRITADYSEIYVLRESPSQVLVIDTQAHEIVDEVDIGPDPTHMYHPNDEEIWAHSDDEGTFYVVDTDSHEVTEVVESGLENEGHGKLLYHEDLGSMGYATNVNDPGVPVIDLENYERSDFIEFADDDEQGTHYKAYAPETGLAYFEFGDETVVVDTEDNEVADTLDFAGGMYLTPNEETLGVLDGDDIRFLDVTTEESEEIGVVEVDEGPDALRYYESEDGAVYGFTAHTQTDQASIIDMEEFEVVDTVDIGDIVRPEDAEHLHRTGVAGNNYFISPADDDGIVTIVDMEAQETLDHVEVEEGVDTVQYVGDSGVGYTGRLR
jgi:DNA-binding beta-propeller fold protein YncE